MENQTAKLTNGDRAPEFNLTDVDGKQFSLSETLKEGSSLLLVFCHGVGCQTCEERLPELQQNWQRFEDRGIRLVAITGKPSDYNRELKQNLKLNFSILADDGTV